MHPLLFLQLLYVFINSIYGLNSEDKTKPAYKHCPIETYQRAFDVLPGSGWDNLANMDMGRILDLNFSECLFSNDNRYLIPNGLSISPLKKSDVELFSETIDHFMNYTSMTARSINTQIEGGMNGYKAGGSFSYETNRVKNDQIQTKSILTRVQLKYNVYRAIFEPDTLLNSAFKNRVLDIAALIIENKDYLYPAYLADMIVRDYGTHVIRSMDVGAILSKTDALNSQYVKKYQSDRTSIAASASASFLSFFSMNVKVNNNVSNQKSEEYNKNCEKTHVDAIGGSLLGSNFSLKIWENSVMNNLVSIDRRGDPIYYVLTPRSLPELDDDTVHKLYVLLKDAVRRYYKRNTRKGCTDFHSPNFNKDANIDSGNCKSPNTNFTLGGVYQICTGPPDQCHDMNQLNPLTGDYSCPKGFSSIMLNSGINKCKEKCTKHFWSSTTCVTYCSYFKIYWCSPDNIGSNHNGFMFGGIVPNSDKICPLGYIPLKFGVNVHICVTINSDPNDLFAIKLGGFYSCNTGNPLAQYFVKKGKTNLMSLKMMDLSYWPKSCPEGYVAHIASIDRGCIISYCTETNKLSFDNLPNLVRPPFIELNYNPNSTKMMVLQNKKGETMIKNKYGSWKLEEVKRKYTNIIYGAVSGILFAMTFVCLIVTVLQRRYYKAKLKQEEMDNFSIEARLSNYGALNNNDSP